MSTILLFLLLLLLQITAFSFATGQQETGNISLGSSLNANNKPYWLSNSDQFAFGFHNEGNKLAVGIWYAKIQQKTIVWTANRDSPLPLSNDVKLLLSGEGIRVMSPDNQVVSATISNIYEPVARPGIRVVFLVFVSFSYHTRYLNGSFRVTPIKIDR